jgi:hypothetical protein
MPAHIRDVRASVLVAYLDESHSRAFYCFAALLAQETSIKSVTAELDDLMGIAAADFGVDPAAEIHGHPIFQGTGEWSGVGIRARVWMFERVLDAVLASDVTILLRGVASARLLTTQQARGYPEKHSREQVCFQHILERIDQVAEMRDTYALLIADDRDDRERHRAHFESYRISGTPGTYMSTRLDRLLDTVYFAPSHPSRLLQAADILAFLYHRWNTKADADPREAEVMARLKAKVFGSGRVHGAGNWP